MSEWEHVYAILGSRTALEESLDWDIDLVDYLMGAWALLDISKLSLPDDVIIAMMLGCLPKNKQQYAENLEKWLQTEYTINNPG
jgi:hypothetical protein